jgi:hypothetical protein
LIAARTGAQYVCVVAIDVRMQASPWAVLHSESLEQALGQEPVHSFCPDPTSQQNLSITVPPIVVGVQSASDEHALGHVSAQKPTSVSDGEDELVEHPTRDTMPATSAAAQSRIAVSFTGYPLHLQTTALRAAEKRVVTSGRERG